MPNPLTPANAAWLKARGAVAVRIGPDGIIEFSARPLRDALTDAARALLARSAQPVTEPLPVVAVLAAPVAMELSAMG